jgi:penicillin amidase
MLRKVIIVLIGTVVVLSAAGGGGYYWLRTSLPRMNGTVVLAGPAAPVEVIRDENAIPHIFADSAKDAYFALGFVHAQDRIWQMEFTRRLGAGRLAEVLGEPALKFDRFLRTLGLYRLAETDYENLSPEVRTAFESYAAGVNAWLENRTGALPPEFLLLGVDPEPWRPADSLVWSRLMAIRLGRNWRTELVRARIADHLAGNGLSSQLLGQLWARPTRATPSTIESVRHAALLSKAMLSSIPTEEVNGGSSNGWVLHGTRTSSGKPILANDPHLSFGAPILWYFARIEAPGLSVTGVTLPGAPLTVLGHNDHIAWGFTNGYGDAEDLFVETTAEHDSTAYLTSTGTQNFLMRVEVIQVKDRDPLHLTVRETRHGPVISDVADDAATIGDGRHVIALASSALRPDDRTIEALYAINRARNWTEFRDAAASFHSPHQNMVIAATDGDIGFISPGRLPVRSNGNGSVPVSGTDGAHDWQGFIPPESLPWGHNPSSGRFVNANNRIVPEGYPYLLTNDWPPPFRAERILELLDRSEPIDVDDMETLQSDIHSAAARQLLPLMLEFEPRAARTREARDLLSRWDYSMRRDRPEPLIYSAWLRQLVVALIDDELGTKLVDAYLELIAYPGLGLVEAALTRNPDWCDDVGTADRETCEDRLDFALLRAIEEISNETDSDMRDWRWGDVHRATFTHRVLTHVPVIRWFADLSIESDGGDHTVNRGTTPRARPGNSFNHLDGSSFKAVYNLADLGDSRFMIPTGQSGNPLSPHYADLLERWRDGGYVRIAGDPADLKKTATGSLLLRPATR